MGIGWSMHRNGAWAFQLQRVHRWRDRLRHLAGSDQTTTEELSDHAFVFFQNCFHLREWIQKTSTIPRSALEAFAATHEMKLCRDLANGTKHLSIDRPSVDAEFSIVREYAPSESLQCRLLVIAGDEKHLLLELADRLVQAWDDFLAPHQDNVVNARPPILTPDPAGADTTG